MRYIDFIRFVVSCPGTYSTPQMIKEYGIYGSLTFLLRAAGAGFLEETGDGAYKPAEYTDNFRRFQRMEQQRMELVELWNREHVAYDENTDRVNGLFKRIKALEISESRLANSKRAENAERHETLGRPSNEDAFQGGMSPEDEYGSENPSAENPSAEAPSAEAPCGEDAGTSTPVNGFLRGLVAGYIRDKASFTEKDIMDGLHLDYDTVSGILQDLTGKGIIRLLDAKSPREDLVDMMSDNDAEPDEEPEYVEPVSTGPDMDQMVKDIKKGIGMVECMADRLADALQQDLACHDLGDPSFAAYRRTAARTDAGLGYVERKALELKNAIMADGNARARDVVRTGSICDNICRVVHELSEFICNPSRADFEDTVSKHIGILLQYTRNLASAIDRMNGKE